MRPLQHLNDATPAGKVGIGVGGDEEFCKVSDNKNNIFYIRLRGEVFEQPVADGSRNKEGVPLGKKAFVVGSKHEDGLYAEVVNGHVAVDNPQAALSGG